MLAELETAHQVVTAGQPETYMQFRHSFVPHFQAIHAGTCQRCGGNCQGQNADVSVVVSVEDMGKGLHVWTTACDAL